MARSPIRSVLSQGKLYWTLRPMHFSDLKAKLFLGRCDEDDAMAPLALAGKVALVTGGSKGIGRATVLGLAKAGAQVAINYGRDADAAQEVVKEIGEKQAFAVQADAGSVAGVQKIVKSTIDAFGKIDILIANAGVLPMKDLEHTTEEDFDKTFALNVKGPYFLVQVFFHQASRQWLSIVLTQSIGCSTTHGSWVPRHSSFHHSQHRFHRGSSLLATLRNQGRHRSDGETHV